MLLVYTSKMIMFSLIFLILKIVQLKANLFKSILVQKINFPNSRDGLVKLVKLWPWILPIKADLLCSRQIMQPQCCIQFFSLSLFLFYSLCIVQETYIQLNKNVSIYIFLYLQNLKFQQGWQLPGFFFYRMLYWKHLLVSSYARILC